MNTSTEPLFWAREGAYVKGVDAVAELRQSGGRGCPLDSHRDGGAISFVLMRFGDGYSPLAGAVDVAYDPQVLVELNAGAECSAWFTPATQQAGQLHKAQILKLHDISAFRRLQRSCLGDRVLRPVEVDASE